MSSRVRKLFPEIIRFASLTARYRVSPIRAARRYWHLYHDRRFSPDEICFLGLLDSTIADARLREFVSKEELLDVQQRLNPRALYHLTEDKVRFHHHCVQRHLPVPAVFALYGYPPGADPSIPQLQGPNEVEAFLRAFAGETLIVKPVAGVHGKGVTRLTRDGDRWIGRNGERRTAAEIAKRLQRSEFSRWMFQEYVQGERELARLTAADGLQTVRVVTLLRPDNTAEILAARLRLICGSAAHDNFDSGRTGNLIANLNAAGEITSVVGSGGRPRSMRYLTHHPGTRRPLLGYRLARWDAVRRLALTAAEAFAPLRTVGWDVAVAEAGPVLIEGNVTWDTLNGEPRMRAIYRTLLKLSAS